MSEEEKVVTEEPNGDLVAEDKPVETPADSSDLDSTFPKEEQSDPPAGEETQEDPDQEDEDEEGDEEEEEDKPTSKPKKKSPPKKKSSPQPQPKKKESTKMAKKNAEAAEQSDHKMIRVSGDVAKRIYQLAAQLQLETGERTNPGDAISFAVEAALK